MSLLLRPVRRKHVSVEPDVGETRMTAQITVCGKNVPEERQAEIICGKNISGKNIKRFAKIIPILHSGQMSESTGKISPEKKSKLWEKYPLQKCGILP
jgi:hypothetical protein